MRPASRPGCHTADCDACLIASPLKVEDIATLVSLDAVGVLKLLGSLELEGLIERMMDGRYAPSKFALHAQTPFGHNGKRVN